MANERLTAEEFRDAIVAADEQAENASSFLAAIDELIVNERTYREELSALDFDDCEGGACKL